MALGWRSKKRAIPSTRPPKKKTIMKMVMIKGRISTLIIFIDRRPLNKTAKLTQINSLRRKEVKPKGKNSRKWGSRTMRN